MAQGMRWMDLGELSDVYYTLPWHRLWLVRQEATVLQPVDDSLYGARVSLTNEFLEIHDWRDLGDDHFTRVPKKTPGRGDKFTVWSIRELPDYSVSLGHSSNQDGFAKQVTWVLPSGISTAASEATLSFEPDFPVSDQSPDAWQEELSGSQADSADRMDQTIVCTGARPEDRKREKCSNKQRDKEEEKVGRADYKQEKSEQGSEQGSEQENEKENEKENEQENEQEKLGYMFLIFEEHVKLYRALQKTMSSRQRGSVCRLLGGTGTGKTHACLYVLFRELAKDFGTLVIKRTDLLGVRQ
ncbi:hypothetical protein GNI_082430 [Gregarina niphandrodes]|uniref:Uncharacterized protein n=1 Tax=Gregarina niphandrodes TaxID=110365 RepID=A0A023B670_GRENI|nr:hypothetical protein GNI_082430 [Gregarina niphandrodes]EZG65671.1 hypothetical protein GNI_082430 [Gregarina niphandrodes]|eukprot:XP_011134064.1 hypothetical protein GNI_082430 [Gregarina niphandrodes]